MKKSVNINQPFVPPEPGRSQAILLIVLLGVVSLFADMNYEGGRSLSGQYLNLLGASAFVLSLAAGLGEFLGYGLRFFSGLLVDKTKSYWFIMFTGYVIQLCALPALALTGDWRRAVDAAAALLLGKLYDKIGYPALLFLFVVEIFTAPLVFMGNTMAIIAGMALWGISMGTQESVLKAVVADRSPKELRGQTFGLFQTVFGAFWFAGSALLGWLYGISVPALVAAAVSLQTVALALSLAAGTVLKKEDQLNGCS